MTKYQHKLRTDLEEMMHQTNLRVDKIELESKKQTGYQKVLKEQLTRSQKTMAVKKDIQKIQE